MPAVNIVPIEDRSAWLESAIRIWEADIHTEGWDKPPRFALLMRLPRGAGLAVAQISIDPFMMGHPDVLFGMLADKRVRYLHQFFGRDWWEGMVPVGGMLCAEGWGLAEGQLDMSLFQAGPAGHVAGHPDRLELRQVMVVAPREENDWSLLRQRGSLEPQLRPGIPPDGFSGAGGKVEPNYSTRDAIRKVVLKLCPPDMR